MDMADRKHLRRLEGRMQGRSASLHPPPKASAPFRRLFLHSAPQISLFPHASGLRIVTMAAFTSPQGIHCPFGFPIPCSHFCKQFIRLSSYCPEWTGPSVFPGGIAELVTFR